MMFELQKAELAAQIKIAKVASKKRLAVKK